MDQCLADSHQLAERRGDTFLVRGAHATSLDSPSGTWHRDRGVREDQEDAIGSELLLDEQCC